MYNFFNNLRRNEKSHNLEVKTFESEQDIHRHGHKFFDTLKTSRLDANTSKAIDSYKGIGYIDINDKLRGRPTIIKADFVENKIDFISQELKKHPTKADFTTFRKISYEAMKSMLGSEVSDISSLKGKILSDKAFLSTAPQLSRISRTVDSDIILKIKVPKGTYAAYMLVNSGKSLEGELLIDKDQNMIVKEIDREGRNITIECELIPKISRK